MYEWLKQESCKLSEFLPSKTYISNIYDILHVEIETISTTNYWLSEKKQEAIQYHLYLKSKIWYIIQTDTWMIERYRNICCYVEVFIFEGL